MDFAILVTFLTSCVLVLNSQLSHAWMGVDRQSVDQAKCLAPNGDLIDPGEKWYDDALCSVYTCNGLPFNLELEIEGCKPVGVPKGCDTKDGKGRFPDCCPVVVCP